MMALTVCEPFASALIFGGKDWENRRKSIHYTGPLIIHAGLSLDWFAEAPWVHKRWSGCPASPLLALHEFKRRMGYAIGIVWVGAPRLPGIDSLLSPLPMWATGPVCIPVSHPMPFDRPFKLRGQRGRFIVPAADLPDEVIAKADDLHHLMAERAA